MQSGNEIAAPGLHCRRQAKKNSARQGNAETDEQKLAIHGDFFETRNVDRTDGGGRTYCGIGDRDPPRTSDGCQQQTLCEHLGARDRRLRRLD